MYSISAVPIITALKIKAIEEYRTKENNQIFKITGIGNATQVKRNCDVSSARWVVTKLKWIIHTAMITHMDPYRP